MMREHFGNSNRSAGAETRQSPSDASRYRAAGILAFDPLSAKKTMKSIQCLLLLVLAGRACAEQQYDLLLQGGHVIDPKNRTSAESDVAIRDRKIAAVAPKIDPRKAFKTVDVKGLYVTPGLIDIHVHVFASTGERNSYAGERSVYPDDFTLRSGVTTVADAGSSGWRNFPAFRETIIARSRTRIFAFLNIVGNGMRGRRYEQDLSDMEPKPAAEMAERHKGVIVGIKTAHYMGPEFAAVDHAIEAGTLAGIPVMVDFGRVSPQKSLAALV
jgi:dihydroorotase